MTEQEEKLWKFEVSLKHVLDRLKSLQSENEKLTEEIQNLSAQLESQKNIIKDLEENNKRVKLAETMSMSQDDNHVLKMQIDGFVKEIDRCLALLNE